MGCNCEPKKYSVSMGCCQPVLGPIEAYYTKFQIDKMLEEIESGITSGCCITPEEVDEKIDEAISGISLDLSDYYTKEEVDALIPEVPSLSGYATEQWVLDKHYISGVDLSDYATKEEIPSLSGYATEQWVEDKHYITGVDLSDYVTYESLPDLTNYATKQWVINQNFALNTELIQYITNLQNQIDSLKQQISGCCGSTGETITRWITMTGTNDYTCSGTTKMTKEKEQTSNDGINWTDTGNYRSGSTVLAENSVDCGYAFPSRYFATYSNGDTVSGDCSEFFAISMGQINLENLVSVTVGECCILLNTACFDEAKSLSSVTIGSNVKKISYLSFHKCSELVNCTILGNALENIGTEAFEYCSKLVSIDIPSSIKRIEKGAFYGCTSLSGITIRATVPPSGVSQFTFDQHLNFPIYVPAESVNAYKTAEGWTSYASRIQAIP